MPISALADVDEATSPPAPSSAPGSKPAAKISCLACRAAKRKCLTPDAFTVCKRCTDQGLECEYQKHRRGRRKKNADEARAPSRSHSRSPSRHESPPSRPLADRERPDKGRSIPSSAISRHSIRFSHVVPIEGDSSPYIPRPSSQPPATGGANLALLGSDCPDPVMSGFLSEADAYELFEFYFHHLNVAVAILDPVLHTATYCRDKSSLLFSAVLTVTAKIIRPEAYPSCLLIANKLVGQAVEYGLCSIEVVQAIIMLTHWKKADDSSSWRKVGYAIRMAQELRLNQRAPRPLPRNERQAREILNRERCWLNLIVADYHLAMHHSLPRMIAQDDVDDPAEWITEHPHLPCPGEAVIAPWISFSRLTRLFADMLASMNGSPSNLRSLHWLEMEYKRWHRRWIEKNSEYGFLQQQVAMIKMCGSLLHFHICEYHLLFTARYRSNGTTMDTSEPSQLSYAFAECTDVALGLLDIFQTDFVAHGYLPFCFNMTWVGVAITSVWLIKNIGAMDKRDRKAVILKLTEVADSTAAASRSSEDMSAYTHRLLKHLLDSASPNWQRAKPSAARDGDAGSASSGPTPGVIAPPHTWTVSSAQQMIQDNLWNPSIFQDIPALRTDAQHQQCVTGNSAYNDNHPPPDPVAQQIPGDVLFPAADDDIWKLLFPL
ncbi:hypothetical protein CspeluHIS016_0302920 [Cutaneotrichosporon spelunceum]|uniref:Zn(2)-C6 fungal-type domain-containing protein n=1 Tax=Cutaneotrichosporon spelunceum TaxID=1672016 RepID=A0AAD3YC04_9TREE|nr:hypothetical protein CspeluHIS016_0302920 [Cutaneotrichosporon spelunceum]